MTQEWGGVVTTIYSQILQLSSGVFLRGYRGPAGNKVLDGPPPPKGGARGIQRAGPSGHPKKMAKPSNRSTISASRHSKKGKRRGVASPIHSSLWNAHCCPGGPQGKLGALLSRGPASDMVFFTMWLMTESASRTGGRVRRAGGGEEP